MSQCEAEVYQVDVAMAGFFFAAGTSGEVLRRLADLSSGAATS